MNHGGQHGSCLQKDFHQPRNGVRGLTGAAATRGGVAISSTFSRRKTSFDYAATISCAPPIPLPKKAAKIACQNRTLRAPPFRGRGDKKQPPPSIWSIWGQHLGSACGVRAWATKPIGPRRGGRELPERQRP